MLIYNKEMKILAVTGGGGSLALGFLIQGGEPWVLVAFLS